MKIAITGANGFVGSNLIKHFQNRGHEVIALVRESSNPNAIPAATNIISTDYADIEAIKSALENCDVLIHNAGKTKALNHSAMMDANVGITENIITAINQLSKSIHLIYISSQAASKPSVNNYPVSEDEPSAPLTSYGISKLAAEHAIRSSCQKPWTIVRPCSVYGCGDRDFLQLFKMAKHGISFKIGSKDRLLNMIHISELASFIELCITTPTAENQVFFATDGHVYHQSDVFTAIAQAMQKNNLTIPIPEPLVKLAFTAGDLLGHILHKEMVVNREKMKEILAESWLANPAKAQNLLGWNPLANLEHYMQETALCYQKLGWL